MSNSSVAQQLLASAFNNYRARHPKFKATKIAQQTGLSYSTVYNPLFMQRRCSADIWLSLMNHFGAIDINTENKVVKIR